MKQCAETIRPVYDDRVTIVLKVTMLPFNKDSDCQQEMCRHASAQLGTAFPLHFKWV